MKEKLLYFIKSNFIIWGFWAVMLIIELTGVCVTSGKFYIRNPLMFLSLMAIFTAVLFSIKSHRGRYWCSFALMLALFLIDLLFIIVYELSGATFDFSMLKLRGDAMTIVESIPVNFAYAAATGLSISAFMVLSNYYMKKAPKPKRIMPYGVIAGLMALVLVFHGSMAYVENRNYNPADLSNRLYSSDSGSYSDRGIVGNFVDELYKGAFFSKVPLGDAQELEDYIYKTTNTPSPMFGKAEGYNLITVLGESFEWFSFMANLTDAGQTDSYPNGFRLSFPDKTDAEIEVILRKLYPNLYRLYDTSVVGLNHHSREKTDISENHSIIGNYPTDCLLNYDYPENTIPYSVPNVLNSLYGVESYSFHDGEYTFYNRSKHHENALGFKKYKASEQMAEEKPDVFTDYGWSNNEHNLDSQMIDACHEEMFPADRRFNTYITTISMHGQHDFRSNFEPYYRQLIDAGIAQYYYNDDYDPEEDPDPIDALKNNNPFIHYAAAALEFDKAIGRIFHWLETTINPATNEPLIENTLLVVFGDHNAYYQSLGDNVKQLYLGDHNDRNYTDLYRVPLMIHVGNQTEQIKIEKFTCTTDIVPTIFDLLGINFYNNINFGSTIFGDEESIIYSRAYNKFITDKLFFSSINNIKYKSPDADEEYIKTVEEKAKVLLDKTSHVNRIFYYDFLSGDRAETYYARLKELNSK